MHFPRAPLTPGGTRQDKGLNTQPPPMVPVLGPGAVGVSPAGMAELEAATRMGVRGEAGLSIKETRFWDSGRVEGSFQSAFNNPQRTSSFQDQAIPAVCWHLTSRRAQVSQAYMGAVS